MTDELTPLPSNAPWYCHWLADNWQCIHREFSTWFIAAVGVLAGLSEIIPTLSPDLQAFLSPSFIHYLMGACSLAALASKFVKQKGMP